MLLDTNVLSELLKPTPSHAVLDWFAEPRGVLYLSAITRAELLVGAARLPVGKRRRALEAGLHELFDIRFPARCLPFDAGAADRFAEIKEHRFRQGRGISTEDAQIAAIALEQALVLVTRNADDFDDIPGLELINPWES